MSGKVRLLHSVHRSRLEGALKIGLRAVSEYDDLGLEMRRGVVYCWMKESDDRLSAGGQRADYAYVVVTVDVDRCVVADMEWSSLAMMYRQGSGSKPKNLEAARLLAELYRVTAVPLSEYREGMFWTPEVLVKGDIAPECIEVFVNSVRYSCDIN